jgi:VCBS repeat-containing protein
VQKYLLLDKAGRYSARLIFVLVALSITGDLWASGRRPVARNDSAEVERGGVVAQLTSGADSVLANDFDAEGDRLIAVLSDNVKHGVLVLRPDGSFTYQHDGGNSDSDTFKYSAFDGTKFSKSARVTITITDDANSPPFVVAEVPDQQAIEGVFYQLQVAGNFDDPDAGDELRFSVRGLPKGNSLSIDANSGVLSGTPVSSDVRTDPYTVEVTATDLAGASASLSFPLLIFRDNRADIALSISLAENPVSLGETAQWNIRIENRGPGDLVDGQFTANWATSGPSLTLTSTDSCPITGNGTSSPQMSCAVGALAAMTSKTIIVEGTQDGDGDNSLIGVVSSDDPILENNSDLASSQVVAEFSEGPTQIISVSGAGVDAGDLDGDGAIDIVATAGQTFIFSNNGNRQVNTPGVGLGSDTGGSAVTLLDWNGDSSLDIAVGGLTGRTAEVFVNDGTGGFSSTDQLTGGAVGVLNDMLGADLNNDGRSDLLLTGSSGTVILHSLSEGGFDQTALSTGAGLDVAIADIDQDGDQDLIVVRLSDRAVDMHYNSGDGTTYSLTRLNEGSVATVSVSDLNGDGAVDLLLGIDGDDLNTPANKVLYQQASGGFSSGGSFGASPVTALLSGDVDADGWADIVAVNEAGVHQLYLGSSGSGFTLAAEQIVSSGMRRGVLVDFNSDESLDLVMVGRDATVLEVHANNGIGRLGLGDRLAPTLELVGDTTLNIAAGQEYLDPGATAIDDIDGDISDKIVVSGIINPSAVGTQTISYTVADRAGNTTRKLRTVNVGVNAGTGGSGGGGLAPALIVILTLVAAAKRRRVDIERKNGG